jgi:hypothetical protein
MSRPCCFQPQPSSVRGARVAVNEEWAATLLLDALFESRVGFGWPTEHLAARIVDRAAFHQIVGSLKRLLDARSATACTHADVPIVVG